MLVKKLFLLLSGKRGPGDLSLSAHLTGLCAGVAIPLLLLSGFLLYETGASGRASLELAALDEAREVALLLESDLAGVIAMVQALATSPSLQSGDLDVFDHHARSLLAVEGSHIVLRDRSGQQLVDTRVSRGTPLPWVDAAAQAFHRSDIESRSPQVSGLVTSENSQARLYLVEVPVIRDGKVIYLLNASLPIERLGKTLARERLPNGWWLTVVDRTGTIMARTLSPETMIGKKVVRAVRDAIAAGTKESGIYYMTSLEGIRNFSAFRRVEQSGWAVNVAVPEAVLLAPLHRSLQLIGLLVGLALTTASGLALFYGARISRGVISLTEAVAALGHGEPITAHRSSVRELDAAGIGLVATERELALRASERDDLLATLGRSPAIVHALDGRVSFWGSGAERLFGWTDAEAIGRFAHEFLATEFPRPLAEIKTQLLECGHWEGELRLRSKSGEHLVVASYWALQRDPICGAPLAVVETNTDMTAKKAEQTMAVAKAEAEMANRAKSTFLAAASHDLRQPFQAMRLFHQVLEMRAGPELAPIIENLGKAMSSGEELLAGILDLSVLETGTIQPKPASFAINEVLSEVANDCVSVAGAAGLTLRLVPSHALVHTDRVLLKRMIRNLVVNAIRYTNEGGILIGCRRRGGKLVAQVIDTGIGIPKDKLAWIFEEFYQVSNPARDRARGLGLGLAIVNRLSCLLGHPVSVASTLGKGSVFSVEIAMAERISASGWRCAPAPVAHIP